jgi:hypothetical protein
MANAMDLRELWEARNGKPTEYQAARKIATFAVIPAALAGLWAGTQLVNQADSFLRLLLVCVATSSVASFGTAYLILGIYALCGFRPLAILADAIAGALYGFLLGGTLSLILMSLNLVPLARMLWPLWLIPIGAIVVPLFRILSGR